MTAIPHGEVHIADIDRDDDGWWWLHCECGWFEGPFPGRSDAQDAYDDHRDEVAG